MIRTLFLLVVSLTAGSFAAERVPWTTSRVQGSPEKPLNYRIEPLYLPVRFTNAVDLAFNQHLKRWFVAEQGGKIFTFRPGETPELAADFGPVQTRDGSLYAFTFDPNFASNHFIYVCYALKSDLPDGTHVSRFKVETAPQPRIDLSSEEILITWLSGGHNGCGLVFGPDGYLYISTGDAAGPNPPDPLHTGQDVSDLLSSLLRIDVHKPANGRKYSIPSDNPFVGRPNTRPEIWAFGFRNPWRFGIDQRSGEVWVADVGWELWELIYRVKPGGNYGWSIVEGRQPVNTTDTPGPGPILPPIKEHPHSEAASVTGGFVYYGRKFPELSGAFLYGDWETGKIWGLRADGEKVTFSQELADSTIRIIAFAEDESGEPVILDYNGGLYSLERNPGASHAPAFPKTLSETGLFSSVQKHELAPGVLPFEVIAPMWNDYASAERVIALPFLSSITNRERPWRYPSNAVLGRTISLELERGRPASRKRIETQLLHFSGDGWGAYSYRWNEEQTDATLVPAEGAETILKVTDTSEPGGLRVQPWRFHARAECLRCHNPWVGTALGFQPEQLSSTSIKALESQKLFASPHKDNNAFRLVSPYDTSQDLTARARSYLHVNCSACHRENAGGSVPAVMNTELPLDKMRMVNARPTRGDLGLTGARVIASGDPFHSVTLFRMSSTGRSRMPLIGSRLVDEEGIALLREWIESLPGANASSQAGALRAIRTSILEPKANIVRLVAEEITSTSKALRLAHAISHPSTPPERKEQVARAAMNGTNSLVRELFERFLPADSRSFASQSTATREKILKLTGNAERGAALLADTTRLSCLQCHQYGGSGRNFGPDFKAAAAHKSRAEILDHILEPSKQIAPEYILYTADFSDGEQISGFITTRNDREVVMRDAAAVEHRIPATRIQSLRTQQLSAMPEGLLAGLSAQEVADLLEALLQSAAR